MGNVHYNSYSYSLPSERLSLKTNFGWCFVFRWCVCVRNELGVVIVDFNVVLFYSIEFEIQRQMQEGRICIFHPKRRCCMLYRLQLNSRK